LLGEQIPLAARIFAVAEVWEVLRSERPYRKAWSDEQARTYIYSASGTHFDARIVDVFRNLNARGLLPPRV
jgi:HD-GYP domain-containing protein (c-di-GMP phosphodiesterase class II)